MLSNAAFFMGLPGQRAIPWLSVALAIAALVCAAVGIMRAFRRSQVYGGKVSSTILSVVSLLICGLVVVASISSRAMPAATNAPQVGQKVPDFTLTDTTGTKVSLEQLLGKSDLPVSFPIDLSATGPIDPNANAPLRLPIAMSSDVWPKAVLLVFYRGYW
jgi:hypothetical protein